jgi:hypothetical protein
MLKKHVDACLPIKRKIKALEKTAKRAREEQEKSENGSTSSEDEPLGPRSKEYKKIEEDGWCRECPQKLTSDENWWCESCGYGLCEGCRPDFALDHLYGCSATLKNTKSKRTKVNE